MSSFEANDWHRQIKQLDGLDEQTINSLCISLYSVIKGNPVYIPDTISKEEFVRVLWAYIIKAVIEYTDINISNELKSIDCNPHFEEKFLQYFRIYRDSITNILINRTFFNSYDQYVCLKWRFATRLATKCCREVFEPEIVLCFHIKNINNQLKCFKIRCTIADLYRILHKISQVVCRNSANLLQS